MPQSPEATLDYSKAQARGCERCDFSGSGLSVISGQRETSIRPLLDTLGQPPRLSVVSGQRESSFSPLSEIWQSNRSSVESGQREISFKPLSDTLWQPVRLSVGERAA